MQARRSQKEELVGSPSSTAAKAAKAEDQEQQGEDAQVFENSFETDSHDSSRALGR